MNILLVGNFDFDSSNANALRVRGLSRALLLAGHSVAVLDNRSPVPSREPVSADDPVGLKSVDEYRSGLYGMIPAAARGLFIGDVSARQVARDPNKPDLIILCTTHLGYLRRFLRLSRRLRVPLVVDVVEWYQPEDLPGGRFGPYAFANELSMRHATKRADGIIAISSRLAQHYLQAGNPVVSIPPMFDPASQLAEKWSAQDGKLHLCYAGTPGRKEALALILVALDQVAGKGIDVTLHAVGLTAEGLGEIRRREAPAIDNSTLELIRCYGRVPNATAKDLVSRSDFALLLRPLRKANQYGFPSKLSESMSVGTPLISNDFSDVSRHLRDGENSIVIRNLSLDAVVEAVGRAAGMSLAQRRQMSESALIEARREFSPRASASVLSLFLQGLV